ncbi:hypothetical protein GAY28_15750, partial [Azospirillum brasilense]|nr:hypothetical protein [Azospirillum brasilense]
MPAHTAIAAQPTAVPPRPQAAAMALPPVPPPRPPRLFLPLAHDGAARGGAMFGALGAGAPMPARQPLDRAMLTRLSDERGEEACARLAAAFLDELPQRTSRLRFRQWAAGFTALAQA